MRPVLLLSADFLSVDERWIWLLLKCHCQWSSIHSNSMKVVVHVEDLLLLRSELILVVALVHNSQSHGAWHEDVVVCLWSCYC